MSHALIVEAVRSPIGRRNGKLAGVRPDALLHEPERSGGRFGQGTTCSGFGQGIATLIERL